MKKNFLYKIVVLIILLGFGISSYVFALNNNENDEYIIKDNEILKLNKIWEFYPNQLLNLSEINNATDDERLKVKLPSSWINYEFNGEKLSAYGNGTFHIKVKNDTYNKLKIIIPRIYGEYEVYIYDESLISSGIICRSNHNIEPSLERKECTFETPSKEFDIIIYVSNYVYGKPGIRDSIIIGSEGDIDNYLFKTIFINAIKIIVLILIMIYSLIIFFIQRKLVYAKLSFFSLLVLLLYIFEDIYFLQMFGISFNSNVYIYDGFIFLFLILFIYTNIYYDLLSKYFNKKIYNIINFIIAIQFVSIFIVTTQFLATKFVFSAVITIIFIGIYLFYITIKAYINDEFNAKFLLIANVILQLFGIHDVLMLTSIIDFIDMQLLPIAFIIVIIVSIFTLYKIDYLKNTIEIEQKKIFNLLDNMPVGVIEIDEKNNILFINNNLRETLKLGNTKLREIEINNIIDIEFFNFLKNQLESMKNISNYQKPVGNKIYQISLRKKKNVNTTTYIMLFFDRTEEIKYGKTLEKVMNNLENTVKKRTESLNVFKELVNKINQLNSLNIEEEDQFLKELFRIGMELINKATIGSIYLFENNKVRFIDTRGHDLEKLNTLDISMLDFEFPTNSIRFVKNIASRTEDKFYNENKIDKQEDYKAGVVDVKETAIIGLAFDNKVIGGMSFEISADSDDYFDSIDKKFINALVGVFNSSYQNFKSQKEKEYDMYSRQLELKNELKLDGLTEIYNKKYFLEIYESFWKHSISNRTNISIIMIDIDNFKNYNDTYGHVKGDFVLKEVAKALKLRENDIVARYGGEEFIVLVNDISNEMVIAIADRIREAVELLNIENIVSDKLRKLTISLGVATTIADKNMESIDLIKKADKNLYKAKNSGRNRVVSSN